MKISSFLIFLISLTIASYGAYDPNQFIIGTFSGPILNGYNNVAIDHAIYKQMEDDHYNLVLVDISQKNYQYFRNSDLKKAAPDPGSVPDIYRLQCLSGLNLKTLIFDNYVTGIINECYNTWWDYNKSSVQNQIISNYISLPQELQDRMIGYYLVDEPTVGNDTLINKILKNQSWLNHPGMIGFINLNAHAGTDPSGYDAYVSKFANDTNTKVLCFDRYNIFDNTRRKPAESGYWVSPYLYRNYELFAEKIKETKRSDLRFWACIQGSRPDASAFQNFNPSAISAAYSLNLALVYGAKGIIWYCWHQWNTEKYPDKECSIATSSVRPDIANLNGQLERMSNILTKLTWINTVHGLPSDPQTKENDLKTPDKETTVLKMNGTGQLNGNLMIGVFKSGTANYLMVFNKDLINNHTQTIVVKGTQYNPMNFNKNNGLWEQLTSTKNSKKNTTSFTVSELGPAEMRLIRLNTDLSK
jgi:hypothetical protein